MAEESLTRATAHYCQHCGEQPPADAIFCHRCGNQLSADDAAAPPAAAALAPGAQAFSGPSQGLPDEVETWQGNYSTLAMMGTWLAFGCLTVLALVGGALWIRGGGAWLAVFLIIALVWAGLGLRLLYRKLSVHYYLTNQRLIHERGLLWRVIDRVELIDVDDISFHQGPVERLFGVGTIRIHSSDQSHPQIDLPGIDQVREISDTMDELRRAERQRRGLHIEAI